jgi:hypothetical protein
MKSIMRRATIVYICMIGLLIGGLWTILRIGRNLRPPHNLSGQWLCRPVEALESEPLPLEVIQSGRFLTVHFPKMDPLKFTFKKEELDPSGKVTAIHWEGSNAKLVVRLPQPNPKPEDTIIRYWFELEKPVRATWRARRVPTDEVTAVPTGAAH